MSRPSDDLELPSVDLDELRALSKTEYLRRYLRIVTKRGGEPIPFEPKYGQRKVIEAIERQERDGQPIRIIILKSRQVGISTLVQGLLYRLIHLFKNRQALVLAHKKDSAHHLFQMSRRFWSFMDPSVQGKKKYLSRAHIQLESTDSRLQVEVVGEVRSYTAQQVHLSELAFYEEPKLTLDAILQCVPDLPDSMVVVESTPNGLGNYFHDLWQLAKQPQSGWMPVFIAWFDDEHNQREDHTIADDLSDVDAEERLLVEKHALTRLQLQWRRWAIRNKCGNDINTFNQEYPSDDESCFISSGRAVFDRDAFKHYFAALSAQPEPGRFSLEMEGERVIAVPNAEGYWWIAKHPEPRRQYIESHDSSAGEKHSDPKKCSDPTPLLVLDRHSLDFTAMFHDIRPPWEMKIEAEKCARYYNNALVAPEDNGHGRHFIRELLKTYHNVYFRESRIQSVTGDVGDVPGWNTNVVTRDLGIDTLRHYFVMRMGAIPFRPLLLEMAQMQYVRNAAGTDERPEVPTGYHDDLIMCAVICLMAHKGGLDAALAPLPMEDLQPALESLRLGRVAASMGLDAEELPLDRTGITAEQLEALDEAEYNRSRRRERSGLGESI